MYTYMNVYLRDIHVDIWIYFYAIAAALLLYIFQSYPEVLGHYLLLFSF